MARSEEEGRLWHLLDPLLDRERWTLVGFLLPSFRQLRNIVLPLDGLAVIVGTNGSGKTSLLEAIRTTGSAASATFASRDLVEPIEAPEYEDYGLEEYFENARKRQLLRSDLSTLRLAAETSQYRPADAAFVYQVEPPEGFDPGEIAREMFKDVEDEALRRRSEAALVDALGVPHIATFPNRAERLLDRSLVLGAPTGLIKTSTGPSSGNSIVENLLRAYRLEAERGWVEIAAMRGRPHFLHGPRVQVLSMRDDTLHEEVTNAVRRIRDERALATEQGDLDPDTSFDPNVAVWAGFVQLPTDPDVLSSADREKLITETLSTRWFRDATHIVLGVAHSESSARWLGEYLLSRGFADPVFDPANVIEIAPLDDPHQLGVLLTTAKAELRSTGLFEILQHFDSEDVLGEEADEELQTTWLNSSSFWSGLTLLGESFTGWSSTVAELGLTIGVGAVIGANLSGATSIWDPNLKPPEFTAVAEGGIGIAPATREVLVELEREANQVAPEFVTRSGRILITVDITAEHPIGVKFLDPTGLRHLHELGRGIQRWIAASVRLAARRIAGETGGGILLIDEPELALHPDAQDQIADWCVDAAPFYKAIVIASHSPSFLSLPTSGASTYILRSSHDGHSVLNPLEVESLAGLASVGEAAGLGRMTLLSTVRGFVVVEGPADVQVLKAFMGAELRQHRVVPVPMHGHGRLKALVQPHLLEALGRPVAVMLDDVAREVIDGTREASSEEEKSIAKVLAARDEGLPIAAVSFEAPDIIAGLPETAVKRVAPMFTSWNELLSSWDRDGEDNFKRHVLRSVQWKLHDDRGFISAVVEAIDADDRWPPWIMRTRSELLAWSDQAHGR